MFVTSALAVNTARVRAALSWRPAVSPEALSSLALISVEP